MNDDDMARWLREPPLSADFAGLARIWRRTVFSVVARRPDDFETGPWTGAALRGALGHALMRAAAADPDARAAVGVLFPAWSRLTPGRSVPAPFVVAVDTSGGELCLDLTLFGFADRFREPIFDGFLAALAAGISMGPGSHRSRPPIEILSADWSRLERVVVPRPTSSARLIFETPVRLGPRRAISARWDDLVVGLADRVGRLARWQGVAVDMRLGVWRERAKTLRFRDDTMFPVAWGRRSGRQQGRAIPMAGLLGALDIDRVPEDLLTLLAIGETCHAGAHTALGLGRFRLIC